MTENRKSLKSFIVVVILLSEAPSWWFLSFRSVLSVIDVSLGLFSGVLLNGFGNFSRDWSSSWDVVTWCSKTVFIGDVIYGVKDAIRTGVRVRALNNVEFLIGSLIFYFSNFLLSDLVLCFETIGRVKRLTFQADESMS